MNSAQLIRDTLKRTVDRSGEVESAHRYVAQALLVNRNKDITFNSTHDSLIDRLPEQ